MKTIACKIINVTVTDVDENGIATTSVVPTIYPSESLPEGEHIIFDGSTNTYKVPQDKRDMDTIKMNYPSVKSIIDKQALAREQAKAKGDSTPK